MRIHQVWIGDRPAPVQWMKTFSDFCSRYGHEYVLWDNAEVSRLDLRQYPGIAELYDEYGRTKTRQRYSGQVDILRLVILLEHGGLYIDADMVVVRPDAFDAFLASMGDRAFVGWESADTLVANSVIAARRGEPFIAQCLDRLPLFAETHADRPTWCRSGPGFLSDVLLSSGDTYRDRVMIVPKALFYADGWHRIRDTRVHEHRSFPSETLLFQYGYTTNDLGDVLGCGITGRLRQTVLRPLRRLWRSAAKRLPARAASAGEPRAGVYSKIG